MAPELASHKPEWLRGLLVHMQRVRCMDERMLKLQRAGRIGFVGSCKGLEAGMIGTAAALKPEDWLWSGLREGGAAIMRGLPVSEYIAQMYCNSNDTARGRQMCNHFQHKGSHYPSWSSVIGTQIPHGVGAAFASKQRNESVVHGIYFGDGASSSNGFHSAMNFAGVWKVPAVFVLVDNGWAISVPSNRQTASAYVDKGVAYGIEAHEVDGNDVVATFEAMQELVEAARTLSRPALLVVKTYRIMGHSSSDDPTKYRDEREVEEWAKRDPIETFDRRLQVAGVIDSEFLEDTRTDLLKEIDAVIHEQERAPGMPIKSLVEDVYEDVPHHLRRQYNRFIEVADQYGDAQPGDGAFPL